MKKAVSFLSLFVFMVCLLSCSKDDEEYSLSGTTWKWGNIDDNLMQTIKFDNSTCTFTILSTVQSVKTTLSYDYSIVYPKVYMDSQSSGYSDLEGTISGENMIVVNTSKSTTIGTFIKQ